MTAARRLYLASTGQNRGKTTTSLGLMAAIAARGHRLGFIKPVGQRFLVVDGTRADEDAILMQAVFNLPDALNDMSPVTLPRHFTTDYVMGRVHEDLAGEVLAAADRVSADRDLVVIEGTGHAGVGSVVDLSNARVAQLLEAPVVIVSEGGVGRPIDEIVLNRALFEREGVRVLGAVVNKVNTALHADLPEILARGLAQHDIPLVGCIPYSELLANPSLELVATHLQGELLAGEPRPNVTIGQVAVGAMLVKHAVPVLRDRALLITPGDREDLIRAVLEARLVHGPRPRVVGLLLTGGFRPDLGLIEELRRADLFTFLVDSDTHHAAQAVDAILVKTHPSDTEKIETIIRLVGAALPVDELLVRL